MWHWFESMKLGNTVPWQTYWARFLSSIEHLATTGAAPRSSKCLVSPNISRCNQIRRDFFQKNTRLIVIVNKFEDLELSLRKCFPSWWALKLSNNNGRGQRTLPANVCDAIANTHLNWMIALMSRGPGTSFCVSNTLDLERTSFCATWLEIHYPPFLRPGAVLRYWPWLRNHDLRRLSVPCHVSASPENMMPWCHCDWI
jgi:hypothetical protein